MQADQYAYTAGSSSLSIRFPAWALEGGSAQVGARLQDANTWARIKREMQALYTERGFTDLSWAAVASYRADPSLNGLTMKQVAEKLSGSGTADAQLEAARTLMIGGGASMVYHFMGEDDIARIMRHPMVSFASDSGVLQTGNGVPHPRGYGNNARVLAEYVRERKIVSLEDAVRKMTSLPAEFFGFAGRGVIQVGAAADLVVFDPTDGQGRSHLRRAARLRVRHPARARQRRLRRARWKDDRRQARTNPAPPEVIMISSHGGTEEHGGTEHDARGFSKSLMASHAASEPPKSVLRASVILRASVRTVCALIVVLLFAAPAAAAEPVVGVWYRGMPAGTPRQDDLAVLRALGFNGVAWPAAQTDGLDTVRAMAKVVGLQVIVASAAPPLDAVSALTPPTHVNIVVTPENAASIAPLAWRAVAHGARAIAFDAGAPQGAGLNAPDGSLKPWVRDAIGIARQLTANARLVDVLTPGPGVIVAPTAGTSASDAAPAAPGARHALDVVLLDGDWSWVLVATNLSNAPAQAIVRLPAGAPYAIWVSWIDGSTLAMAGELAGPRWTLQMDAHSVRVYLIDKATKSP